MYKDAFYELKGKYDQLQAENERLKEENRWIPVSERLPEIYEDVVCFRSRTVLVWSGKEMLGAELAWLDRDKGWCYCQGELGHGDFITHWKPIISPNQALKGT